MPVDDRRRQLTASGRPRQRYGKRFLQFHFTTITLTTVFGYPAFHPETTLRQ
jgi:hypothetical protein